METFASFTLPGIPVAVASVGMGLGFVTWFSNTLKLVLSSARDLFLPFLEGLRLRDWKSAWVLAYNYHLI